jgi:non-homologous end joining protein Ku
VAEPASNVVELTELLKRSLRGRDAATGAMRPAAKKAAPRRAAAQRRA